MRKIILQMMVSVDGYYEGPNRDISWHVVEKEYNEYAAELLENLGGLIFGRLTYEMMAAYWPQASVIESDPVIAKYMNALPKHVVSSSIDHADWNNSHVITGDVIYALRKLKDEPGKDLAIFGSSDLAVSLIPHGLIDEFRVFVAPVALGAGKPFLAGLPKHLALTLTEHRTFSSGVTALFYVPSSAVR
jgi:dihydrofolate reductase